MDVRQGHAQGKVPHHLGLAGGGGCIFRIEWRPPSRDCSQKAKVQLTYLYVTEFCVPDLQRVRSLQIEAPVPNMTRPALLEVSASPAMAPGSTAMAPHKRYPEKGKFLHCINGEVHPLLRPRPLLPPRGPKNTRHLPLTSAPPSADFLKNQPDSVREAARAACRRRCRVCPRMQQPQQLATR